LPVGGTRHTREGVSEESSLGYVPENDQETKEAFEISAPRAWPATGDIQSPRK
jgi:hypothetical protein